MTPTSRQATPSVLRTDRIPDLLKSLDARRRATPDAVAVVTYDARRSVAADRLVVRESVSTSELWHQVLATGAALRQRGIVAGDIVAVQLPNWSEFLVLFLALHAIGAVTSPISPILRQRDVRRQLELSRARALVVPADFGKFDYLGMARALQALPGLDLVVCVGDGDGDGAQCTADARTVSFQQLVHEGSVARLQREREEIGRGRHARSADEMMILNFTSGTSGTPKGVMHSLHTVGSCVVPTIERLQLHAQDTVLVVPTLGHGAGILNGLYLPMFLGAKVVYLDGWDAATALQCIARERVSYAPVMPTYLVDMAELPVSKGEDLSCWRTARVSGGTIPRDVMRRVLERVPGLRLCSGWGMSETLWSTCGGPDDPLQKRHGTDGRPVGDTRIEIRDKDLARTLDPGEVGEIVIRGSSIALGYYGSAELTQAAYTADGWFKTGDMGRLDAEGYLTLSGRSKDLVIRGGENVPVVEVEALLQQHPKVRAVAVVGVPDARLGERVCAVVEARQADNMPTLAELAAFLKDHQLTLQFIPEQLLVLPELPRTPVGKVMKQAVRDLAAQAASTS